MIRLADLFVSFKWSNLVQYFIHYFIHLYTLSTFSYCLLHLCYNSSILCVAVREALKVVKRGKGHKVWLPVNPKGRMLSMDFYFAILVNNKCSNINYIFNDIIINTVATTIKDIIDLNWLTFQFVNRPIWLHIFSSCGGRWAQCFQFTYCFTK